MNFELTEEQRMVVDTVAQFVKKELPVKRMRRMREDPVGWSPDVWRQLGRQGWLGVMFPEELGGSGGGFVDGALVLAELGATLVSEPVLSLYAAGAAILAAGDDAQRKRWLTPAIGGERSLALAWTEADGRFDPGAVATRAQGGKLTGEKRWVLNGHAADELVVSAVEGGQVGLWVVAREAAGVEVKTLRTVDGHRAAHVRLRDAPGEKLAGDGRAALELAVDAGAAGACAEGWGLLRAALAMTTDYLRTREQFGVKIGTFQALQHRAVDMFVETELCRSMMIAAALAVDDPDADARRAAVSAAKAQLASGGKWVAAQAIQLHGGIGISDEHDVGLYFKRLHALHTIFGDEEHHVARFAALPGFTAGIA